MLAAVIGTIAIVPKQRRWSRAAIILGALLALVGLRFGADSRLLAKGWFWAALAILWATWPAVLVKANRDGVKARR